MGNDDDDDAPHEKPPYIIFHTLVINLKRKIFHGLWGNMSSKCFGICNKDKQKKCINGVKNAYNL